MKFHSMFIFGSDKNMLDQLSQQIYVPSTPSGFMNRDCFLLWTFNFIHFLAEYGAKVNDPTISKNALLILEGQPRKSSSSGTPQKSKCNGSYSSFAYQSCPSNA